MIMIWIICTDIFMVDIQRRNITITTEIMCMNTIMADTIMRIIMTDMTNIMTTAMTGMTMHITTMSMTTITAMRDTTITMRDMITTITTIMNIGA